MLEMCSTTESYPQLHILMSFLNDIFIVLRISYNIFCSYSMPLPTPQHCGWRQADPEHTMASQLIASSEGNKAETPLMSCGTHV